MLIANDLSRSIASGERSRWLGAAPSAKLSQPCVIACARRVLGMCWRMSACTEGGNQWRHVSLAVTGPYIPNLSPVRYCAACNAHSLAVSKPMHPQLWKIPCQWKRVDYGDEFLQTLRKLHGIWNGMEYHCLYSVPY